MKGRIPGTSEGADGGSSPIVCLDVLSGGFNISLLLCKRTVPIQALIPTAVHSRGTPAQPAYPAVHLESTTRATCEYPTIGTGGPASIQQSSKIKYKEIHLQYPKITTANKDAAPSKLTFRQTGHATQQRKSPCGEVVLSILYGGC